MVHFLYGVTKTLHYITTFTGVKNSQEKRYGTSTSKGSKTCTTFDTFQFGLLNSTAHTHSKHTLPDFKPNNKTRHALFHTQKACYEGQDTFISITKNQCIMYEIH